MRSSPLGLLLFNVPPWYTFCEKSDYSHPPLHMTPESSVSEVQFKDQSPWNHLELLAQELFLWSHRDSDSTRMGPRSLNFEWAPWVILMQAKVWGVRARPNRRSTFKLQSSLMCLATSRINMRNPIHQPSKQSCQNVLVFPTPFLVL